VVYGLRAALALGEHRPRAIRRVLHSKLIRKSIGSLLKATAEYKKPYREVETDHLDRVAGTPHHEGVVVVSSPLLTYPFGTRQDQLRHARCLVAVDQVTNPHNLGAILRSMAWFGAEALLTNDPQSAVNAATIRVSQGGAELIPVIRCQDLARVLVALGEGGMMTIAGDQKASKTLGPDLHDKPTCIVLGSENQGISPAVREACNQRARIPGVGGVESLNVAVAAGVMLAATAPIGPPA
jgi:TrmH RNA methyltransferase